MDKISQASSSSSSTSSSEDPKQLQLPGGSSGSGRLSCSVSGSSTTLNPVIDMSTLHQLSPGGCSFPAPPPPSPLIFSQSATTTGSMAMGGMAQGSESLDQPSNNSSSTINEPCTSAFATAAAAAAAVVAIKPFSNPNVDKILKLGSGGGEHGHEKSPIRRFFIPPTLEKKHSSGDLHSRLKTRKILGVGETDNGDIHRSKISQVLGHNEHLYLKLPTGYWNWQIFLSGFLGLEALLLILMPSFARTLGLIGIPTMNQIGDIMLRNQNSSSASRSGGGGSGLSSSSGDEAPAAASSSEAAAGTAMNHHYYYPTSGDQYYGAALLAFSFLLWKFLHVNDKMIIRATQFTTLIHFTMICAIDLITMLQHGFSALSDKWVIILFVLRLTICGVCYLYLNWLGLPSSGLRRSPSSYKDPSNNMGNVAMQQVNTSAAVAGAGAGAGLENNGGGGNSAKDK